MRNVLFASAMDSACVGWSGESYNFMDVPKIQMPILKCCLFCLVSFTNAKNLGF